jgi:hypothetical protein
LTVPVQTTRPRSSRRRLNAPEVVGTEFRFFVQQIEDAPRAIRLRPGVRQEVGVIEPTMRWLAVTMIPDGGS